LGRQALWQRWNIFDRGYARLRGVSTGAWLKRFDAMDWGNGYMQRDIRYRLSDISFGEEKGGEWKCKSMRVKELKSGSGSWGGSLGDKTQGLRSFAQKARSG
jgi:hypothetical protein